VRQFSIGQCFGFLSLDIKLNLLPLTSDCKD
jgi:hypothetical protein